MPYVIWLHLKIIINYCLCNVFLELQGDFGWKTEVQCACKVIEIGFLLSKTVLLSEFHKHCFRKHLHLN